MPPCKALYGKDLSNGMGGAS